MKKITEKSSSYKEEKEHNTMTTYVSIPESIINSVIDPMVDENDKTRIEAFLKGLKVDPSMFPVAVEAEKTTKTTKTKKAEEATKTKKGKKAEKTEKDGPKKAPNTYNLFMKAFLQVHKDEYDDKKERFKAMTNTWSSTKDDKDARDALLEKYNVVQAVKKDEE